MHYENPNLTIVRGDDSDALGNTWEIELESDYDFKDCSAILQIGPLQYYYDNIVSKILPLKVSKEDSMKLDEGIINAAIKITDKNGKEVTICSSLPINVVSKVVADE